MDETAVIFNIQNYCIHDGPGIRTTVFFKGCPLRCIWCQNPESQSRELEQMFLAHRCVGCGHCMEVCSHSAIKIENGIAVTDRNLCDERALYKALCIDACFYNARELVGKSMSVREVYEQLLKDKIFFDQSKGGVTLSGGEPLFYPHFAEKLLTLCDESGIHTAVETCAFASMQAINRVFPHLRYAMIDIKHMNSDAHRRLTGVGNEIILRNIEYIVHHFAIPVTIRLPIVPACNDSETNIRETALFIKNKLSDKICLQLLPYHRLGEGKSSGLGKKNIFTTKPPSPEQMAYLRHIAEDCGIKAQVGG